MKFAENEARREGIESVTEFFGAQPDGARISWLEIEKATGVRTTGVRAQEGRAWCRVALRRSKRAYAPLPDGLGIQLSDKHNSVTIAALRTKKIVGVARAAHRSVTFSLARHEEDLSKEDRELLRANRSVTGAMVAMSKGAAQLPAREDARPKLPRKT